MDYAGTSMAMSYESRLHVSGPAIDRDIVLSMNKPFTYDNLTFYQSGFSQNGGVETTTLTVVENSGRSIPYVATLLMTLGMAFHFMIKLVNSTGNGKKPFTKNGR
jgi:cytochrome c biogenesis protein ResB